MNYSVEEIKNIINKGEVDWCEVLSNGILSDELIDLFSENIDWISLSIQQNLSEYIIRKYHDRLFWQGISGYSKLSLAIIKDFEESIYWNELSRNELVEDETLECFLDKLDWECMSIVRSLEFLEKHPAEVYWSEVSRRGDLTIEFIKKHADELHFYHLCNRMPENITEEIIEHFIKVNNTNFSQFSDAIAVFLYPSEDFIRKHAREFINEEWDSLCEKRKRKGENFSKQFLIEFADCINWKYVVAKGEITEEFISEFKDVIRKKDTRWDGLTLAEDFVYFDCNTSTVTYAKTTLLN